MVAFGVLSVLVAPVTIAGGDPGMGVAMLAFGGALVAMGLIRPAPEGAVGEAEPGSATLRDGRTLRGTWLRASSRRANVAIIGCFAFAIAGVGFIVSGAVVLGAITAGLFGPAGLLALRNRGGDVLLAPEGVAWAGGSTFIAWDAVDEVRLRDIRGTRFVDLVPTDRGAIQTGPLTRALLPLSRGAVSIGLSTLTMDPDAAYDVVVRLMEAPDERPLLASPGGEAALRRLA